MAASVAIAPPARADDIGLSVFEPTPATTGAEFALQAPEVGANGSWVANAVVSHASNPLLFASLTGDGAHTTTALVERSTLMQLGGAYALLDRFELGAHLPLYLQSGEMGAIGTAAKGTARGNLALHGKVRLWRATLRPGTLVAGASAIAVIPTASNGQFTGSDRPEARLLLLGSFTPAVLASRLALSVNVGPVIRGQSQYANIVEKSGVAWGVGASYRILDQLSATAELFGMSMPSGRRPEPTAEAMPAPVMLSPIEGLVGLSVKPDRRISVGLAFGRGMTSAPGSPDLRGVLSLAVTPGAPATAPGHPEPPAQERDSDGDGIPDAIDKCPDEPETANGFQDADGCPDAAPETKPSAASPPAPTDARAATRSPATDPNANTATIGPQAATTTAATRPRAAPPSPATDPRAATRTPATDPHAPTTTATPTDSAVNRAATDPAARAKAAEQAFAHGNELMKQRKYPEACAELEQSQRLDPGFGTQYNLAACYDKLGKLATAWNLYRELASSDSNLDRLPKAVRLSAALAARVPKIKLVLPRKPDGVQVLLNGSDASAQIGIESPVDLGRHALVVAAPGYRTWRKMIDVTQEAKVVTVVIELEPAR